MSIRNTVGASLPTASTWRSTLPPPPSNPATSSHLASAPHSQGSRPASGGHTTSAMAHSLAAATGPPPPMSAPRRSVTCMERVRASSERQPAAERQQGRASVAARALGAQTDRSEAVARGGACKARASRRPLLCHTVRAALCHLRAPCGARQQGACLHRAHSHTVTHARAHTPHTHRTHDQQRAGCDALRPHHGRTVCAPLWLAPTTRYSSPSSTSVRLRYGLLMGSWKFCVGHHLDRYAPGGGGVVCESECVRVCVSV